MNEKSFFKSMLISVGTLFFLTCFSIIYCVLCSRNVLESQTYSHMMSLIYLFLHLIIEATIFYYAFKAMMNGSSLLKVVMYVKEGIVNKKAKRNALIFFFVFLIVALYMAIILFPLNIFLSFFSTGLKFALMNMFSLGALISLYFFLYGKEAKE